ncbi:MAG: carbonic anhydrase [Myxococcaceae bacterium]|nr:carbonic anhydrase [Myxococcaceae bacterium]
MSTRGIEALLENNRQWVERMTAQDPEYFRRLAREQRPEYLFIGCSDSRVPANTLTGTSPGEMFVHRNIANQFMPHDLNCVSVVQYAVDVLDVAHIIVCGHYGCGGVKAAAASGNNGTVDHWLGEVRGLSRQHKDLLASLAPDEAHRRLVELNVMHQVFQLSLDPTLLRAWAKGRRPAISGLVYELEEGRLRVLASGVDSAEAAARALAGVR